MEDVKITKDELNLVKQNIQDQRFQFYEKQNDLKQTNDNKLETLIFSKIQKREIQSSKMRYGPEMSSFSAITELLEKFSEA